MQGSWHDFEVWREHRRDLLREVEAQRFARAARPDFRERLGKYRGLLHRFAGKILGLGRRVAPSRTVLPPDEEINPSGSGAGLVEAVFEERICPVRSSSVLELHREGEGYVIREVNLSTGDHMLYLSTEEPEWAAWIWERKIHG